jgi:hypothetical protein
MPNICHNSIEILGSAQHVKEFKSRLKAGSLFFDSLIPAPKNAPKEWYEKNWGARELSPWTESDIGVITLDTAWHPPYEFIKTVSRTCPELTFRINYFVLEMRWCGRITIQNGADTDVIYYKMDSDGMKQRDIEYGKEIFGDI